ncbi:unnamed protein product, partial [Iphiclides podalirius]
MSSRARKKRRKRSPLMSRHDALERKMDNMYTILMEKIEAVQPSENRTHPELDSDDDCLDSGDINSEGSDADSEGQSKTLQRAPQEEVWSSVISTCRLSVVDQAHQYSGQNLNSGTDVHISTNASNPYWSVQLGYHSLSVSRSDSRLFSDGAQDGNLLPEKSARNTVNRSSRSNNLKLADSVDVTLHAFYLPDRYYIIADCLSCGNGLPDWHLKRNVVKKIFKKWGTPQVELMRQ